MFRKAIIFIFFLSSIVTYGQENSGFDDFAENYISSGSGTIYKKLNFHRDNFNEDSSLYYVDLLVEAMRRKHPNGVVGGNFQKINTLRLFGRFDEGFKLSLSTFDQFCGATKDSSSCNGCSYIYSKLIEFMSTMKDYRKAIWYLDQNCEANKNDRYYYDKAALYVLLGEPDSALAITGNYLEDRLENATSHELIGIHNNHGLIAKNCGRLDLAIEIFSQAINIIDTSGRNIDRYAFIMGNLGSCYYNQGDYEEAYKCLLIDMRGSLTGGQIGSYLSAATILAEIEVGQRNFQTAIDRIIVMLADYDQTLTGSQKLPLYKLLMKAFEETGNNESYEKYSELWISLNESEYQSKMETHQYLVDENAANSLKQVTKQLETEKELLDQKLKVQEKEEEKNQLRNLLYISALIVIILAILLIFLRYRNVQSRKAIINQARLDSAKQKQEILALKVKEENRNVQTLSLELTTKQDFSKVVLNKLKDIENISKADLKNMEMFIQNEVDIKSTRAQLQDQMGDLSTNFYSELKIKHGNLTETDVKLAAMIVMKMSNKEIAISKNITPESVKIAKNRLKKKLNLAKEISLSDHLDQLL